MPRGVYAPLDQDERRALMTLAQREDRDTRRQATRLLREGLIRAGVLTESKNAPAEPAPATIAG